MKDDLIQEYHYLVLELMEIDPNKEWNKILQDEAFDYKEALLVIRNKIQYVLTSYNSTALFDDNAFIEWSYVNILDTKSQTFLCCTSS